MVTVVDRPVNPGRDPSESVTGTSSLLDYERVTEEVAAAEALGDDKDRWVSPGIVVGAKDTGILCVCF